MHKFTLLLVAVATLALSGTAIQSAADAAGYRSSKQTVGEATVLKGKKKRQAVKSRKQVAAYQRRGKRVRRAPAVKVAAAAKRPGSCGTFMYWKDGKCNDARAKK